MGCEDATSWRPWKGVVKLGEWWKSGKVEVDSGLVEKWTRGQADSTGPLVPRSTHPSTFNPSFRL